MYIHKNLPSGARAEIVFPHDTQVRLRTTCFRGQSVQLAGNFSQWDSLEKLFQDTLVMESFLEEIDGAWLRRDFGTRSVCIVNKTPIGWESTAPLADYAPGDLEQFKPNRRSRGLRVKPTRTDLLAPRTDELTIVYEFKSYGRRPLAIIRSVYPGVDVGNLVGDVTDREQRIFFLWSHPGAI